MGEIIQAYQTFTEKWGGGAFGTSGGNVTWSLATTNYAGRETYDSFMGSLNMDVEGLVAMAFRTWAGVANITFTQVADGPDVGFRFGLQSIDGPDGTTGANTATLLGGEILTANVILDSGENWDSGGKAFSLYGTLLHEIGHGLGLDHEDGSPTLMNSVNGQFGYSIENLFPDDVAGIQAIYGKPAQIIHWGTPYADSLQGAADSEIFQGQGGDDWMAGASGADTMYGKDGLDTLSGNRGLDLIYGNKGADYIDGGLDNDSLYGGQQADVIHGGTGNDLIYGNLASDTLYGETGSELFYGGQGDDVIIGGGQADMIYGNRGNDAMSGGTGGDSFVFANNSGIDVITDFTPGEDLLMIKTNVNGSGLQTVDQVMAALVNGTGGVVLSLGGGHSVQLTGLIVSDLATTDFQMF